MLFYKRVSSMDALNLLAVTLVSGIKMIVDDGGVGVGIVMEMVV